MCSYKKIRPWESIWNPKTSLLQTSALLCGSHIILSPTKQKVKEWIVETLVSSFQQWLCTCVGEDGGASERPPPSGTATDPLGDLGKASKPAQEQSLLLPYRTLCGIRDIPAWMRSKFMLIIYAYIYAYKYLNLFIYLCLYLCL